MPLDQDFEERSDREMGFLDHLEELRSHIFRSAIYLVVTTIVAFSAKDFLFGTLIFGPLRNDFWTYRTLCSLSHYFGYGDSGCIQPSFTGKLQTIGIGEAFNMHFKIAMICGFILALPLILNEVWFFVKPALSKKERRYFRHFVWVCSFLFFIGVAFGYFILSPFSINFLISYELPLTEHRPSASSFIDIIVMLTLPVGLVFELPIVIYFLSKAGIITHRIMADNRRFAYMIIIILAAIVTPPDIISQIIVTIPLIILYELSIMIAKAQTLNNEKSIQIS
jgi:sec-independent protein translocase protein TatC